MTQTARALGLAAMGLDHLAIYPDTRHDLNNPIWLGKQYEMIISIETAEHVENETEFINTIDKHLKPGGKLIFTAAMPGQPGDGHVNCQTPQYWRNKFYERGIKYDNHLTTYLALFWAHMTGGLSAWLVPNLQVFTR